MFARVHKKRDHTMDQRDQELLDKQLSRLSAPPRHDGIMMLGVAMVFFAGVTFGGFLFGKGQAMHTAPHDRAAVVAINGPPPVAR
jgi:hypothetical protein